MKCYNTNCKNDASASFAEKILDVNSTQNKWLTTEPVYKRITLYYCHDCMQTVLNNLRGQKK
ncbi:hypothetical protein [Mesoplasma coleopterae]|uniref:Uncharacterized protein n=1 Tax=Mesoplasma coleopterae TaxID=324078 RepID=A0A2K8P210_9MOLU|nr:hypothetical protein [Mesoplasma coleopterae]ATZ20716.1 hypothetical protein MCOLE_v1c02020 [Mesoplasma coleopterae]AVN62228.1 hypothetical protein CG001_00995 [Mesoplasma coleopterae]AVN62896.1 hypothetical protein CG000_01065 [Mesoplasma coleopterae]